ncbi:MAG: hypothetical protein WC595_06780 [Candidatus Nanoarchaeia archaeon]
MNATQYGHFLEIREKRIEYWEHFGRLPPREDIDDELTYWGEEQ